MEKHPFFDIFDEFCIRPHPTLLIIHQKLISGYSTCLSSVLINFMRKQNLNVQALHLDQHNRDEIQCMLSMGYLGVSIYYYLKGFNELSSGEQEKWIQFIATYKGPHRLFLFAAYDVSFLQTSFCSIVKIPETLIPSELMHWSYFFVQKNLLASLARLIHALEQSVEKIKFDTALMLIYYASVLSPRLIESFVATVLPHFLYDEQSLFVVADTFFAREKKFFLLWKQVFEKYSVQFWINFWMDYVSRAALYSHYKKNLDHENAKLISTRLPFRFINKNWKSHAPSELMNLHNQLYELDYHIKEGLCHERLHIILTTFFNNLTGCLDALVE
jgi:hypothetical protein